MLQDEDDKRRVEQAVHEFYLQAAPQRVVIRFREGVFNEYADEREQDLPDGLNEVWNSLLQLDDSLTIQRLFRDLEGAEEETPSELLTFYEVLLPSEREQAIPLGEQIAAQFAEFTEFVEEAYVESPHAPQPQAPCADPRPYLCAAPDGMGAANFLSAAAGAGVRVVDLERFWAGGHPNLNHLKFFPNLNSPGEADYVANVHVPPGAARPSDAELRQLFQAGVDHATSVLSILGADDGPAGRGLVPGAKLFFASSMTKNQHGKWIESLASQIFRVIRAANNHMRAGDILLVEHQVWGRLQTDCSAKLESPVELESAVRAALNAARRRRIIVIEPAGNSGQELAQLRQYGNCNLNQLGQAGAVMVAACDLPQGAGGPHVRLEQSNFGAHVKCYAWGRDVVSLNQATPALMGTFSQTSAASALVAGMAALLQSLAMSNVPGRPGRPLRPVEMASALSFNRTSPAARPAAGQNIGVMPNLEAIVDHFLPAV